MCSPPTRGSPGLDEAGYADAPVFPAHAGISRDRCPSPPHCRRVPRPRGDLPQFQVHETSNLTCSPPTRGSPEMAQSSEFGQTVFPAHAGISRTGALGMTRTISVPRPRGDLPTV